MPLKVATWARKKSPWIMHVPCGGCNGCDIEIVAALTPYYDLERFGVLQKGSPRHADILLVTGPVTTQIQESLKRIYDLTPNPKMIVAIGNCAITGEIFAEGYTFAGPLDRIIPVDAYVPGCPPKPEAILDGIVKLLQKNSEKGI
ncbi:NADH-quinone oxidoreductase subunit B family protein [Candidatus Bathyarchaeota archaeon]|nr:NADH-quinone oxidoreductase subunit B family protein [Candidatus Bathyarchaeota archaeon]